MHSTALESAHAGCVILSGCRLGPVVVRQDCSGDMRCTERIGGDTTSAIGPAGTLSHDQSRGLPTDGCWEDLESVARAVDRVKREACQQAGNVLCIDEVRETEQLLDGLLNCHRGPIIERFANVLLTESRAG